jgi:hypothetical protein
MLNRLLLPAIVPCFVALIAGCGSKTGQISGNVTYRDKPVASGTVQVEGSDGNLYTSQIAEDGSYKVIGVPFGKAKIRVESTDQERFVAYNKELVATGGPGARAGKSKDAGIKLDLNNF